MVDNIIAFLSSFFYIHLSSFYSVISLISLIVSFENAVIKAVLSTECNIFSMCLLSFVCFHSRNCCTFW